jgi:hypothetical protein
LDNRVNPFINSFFALLPEAYMPFDPLIDDVSEKNIYKHEKDKD